jgi:hypothetical protein
MSAAADSTDLTATLREHAELIASEVKRVVADEHRRSAVV